MPGEFRMHKQMVVTCGIAAAMLGIAVTISMTVPDRSFHNRNENSLRDTLRSYLGWFKEVTIILPRRPFCTGSGSGYFNLVNRPGIQPYFESDRFPLLAPFDVVNVALDKHVTSSDQNPPIIGELEQITDGDMEATDGSFVVLSFDPQWVQIDLGKQYELWGIVMWHYHADPRIYRDVVVQISDDPQFRKDVTTVFNNDRDNSLSMGGGSDFEYIDDYPGKLIRLYGMSGRYIRCHSNGSTADDQNHYIEIEVYGRP